MSFCGATDTPVLGSWWHLLWVSKPEWTALFALGRGIHHVCFLRFLFWCNTCWPLDGQHGGRSLFTHAMVSYFTFDHFTGPVPVQCEKTRGSFCCIELISDEPIRSKYSCEHSHVISLNKIRINSDEVIFDWGQTILGTEFLVWRTITKEAIYEWTLKAYSPEPVCPSTWRVGFVSSPSWLIPRTWLISNHTQINNKVRCLN